MCTSGCLRHPLYAAKRAAVTGKWTAAMSAAVTENGRPLQAAVTVQVQEVGGGRDAGRYCNCTYIDNALTALGPEAGCSNRRCVYRYLVPRLFACQWQRIRHLSIIYYSSTINKGRRCYSYSYINAVLQ